LQLSLIFSQSLRLRRVLETPVSVTRDILLPVRLSGLHPVTWTSALMERFSSFPTTILPDVSESLSSALDSRFSFTWRFDRHALLKWFIFEHAEHFCPMAGQLFPFPHFVEPHREHGGFGRRDFRRWFSF